MTTFAAQLRDVNLQKTKMYREQGMPKCAFIMLFAVLLAVFFQSCKKDAQIPEAIASIPMHLQVKRFDQRFAQATADSIPRLIKQFPYLFPEQYDAAFWQAKIEDTIQVALNREVAKSFPDFEAQRADLETLFKHIEYYYPKTPLPTVVTVTSEVDYRNPVILADTLLIVALDNYLGSEHEFYGGIQKYLTQNFRKEQIDVAVASAFAEKILGSRPRGRRFLDEMIFQGKRLYLMQHLLTLKDKAAVMGYTEEQWQWAQENEVNIWTYFVENELLFNTDGELLNRFINPAPFSKFQMEFDRESPPRLGRFIGWQMVNAYAEKKDIALQELMQLSTDEIFNNATYKPRK
ncbi:gliding motility lipoprotein GldB [Flavimarina sp. Hel_I_48]|uniref:gliding motility lipoprotein GldB n=1 Tax=Flavimarina sp. Hel_I_48 TaxID=1392488 RepID=UPI000691C30B|nr:gliding motility lipoprotein GldB [Flavimarina sp. Hel_I_48]